jgi:hypothetical protein
MAVLAKANSKLLLFIYRSLFIFPKRRIVEKTYDVPFGKKNPSRIADFGFTCMGSTPSQIFAHYFLQKISLGS